MKTMNKAKSTTNLNYEINGRLKEKKTSISPEKIKEFKSSLKIDVSKEILRINCKSENISVKTTKIVCVKKGNIRKNICSVVNKIGKGIVSKINVKSGDKIVKNSKKEGMREGESAKEREENENIENNRKKGKSEEHGESLSSARILKNMEIAAKNMNDQHFYPNIADGTEHRNTPHGSQLPPRCVTPPSSTSINTSPSDSTFPITYISTSITTTSYIAFDPPHAHMKTPLQTHTLSDTFPGVEELYGRREDMGEGEGDKGDGGDCDECDGVFREYEGIEVGTGEEGRAGGGGETKEEGGEREDNKRKNCERLIEEIEREEIKETKEDSEKDSEYDIETGEDTRNDTEDDSEGNAEAERKRERDALSPGEETYEGEEVLTGNSVEDVDINGDFTVVETEVRSCSVGKEKDLSSFFVSTFSPSNSAYHIEQK